MAEQDSITLRVTYNPDDLCLRPTIPASSTTIRKAMLSKSVTPEEADEALSTLGDVSCEYFEIEEVEYIL